MLIFLDTEYTDAIDCDLISIGMVSEDGQYEFYEERSDFRKDWCNSFVHTAVLSQLGSMSSALDRQQLATRLTQWVSKLPGNVTVACDSFTDWELMLDAMDGERPANLWGRYDLREHIDSSIFHHAVVKYHELSGQWHHALHDARAHRHGWLAWQDSRKGAQT
ncbi:hypothetical protein GTP44_11810 [Duganella sp. FT50W]|uniref:Uncharacterized protein n=1 Tax=Duganella lactea TaxID=2692173 RepID=A0A6L8MJC3_9BURK|nr:3'-5' exoribonuclease [Duganella lactea]MYM82639.1 hypothetical protein [Duganella lactea]